MKKDFIDNAFIDASLHPLPIVHLSYLLIIAETGPNRPCYPTNDQGNLALYAPICQRGG